MPSAATIGPRRRFPSGHLLYLVEWRLGHLEDCRRRIESAYACAAPASPSTAGSLAQRTVAGDAGRLKKFVTGRPPFGSPVCPPVEPPLSRRRGGEFLPQQRAGIEGSGGYAAHQEGGLFPLHPHFRANGMAGAAPGCFGTGEIARSRSD